MCFGRILERWPFGSTQADKAVTNAYPFRLALHNLSSSTDAEQNLT